MIKNNYKILLAEDDINLGTILKEFLSIKNFTVTLCEDGESAKEEYDKSQFNLCILDIMMPKKDGFTLAREIRKNDKNIPIIFLTAKSLQEDKIEGFRIGADDYITKPFSTEELLMRINAIMKRVNSNETLTTSDKYQVGNYEFDYEKRQLSINRKVQKLTSKEAELLKLLCDKKNDVLERSTALKLIWREDNYFTGRSMDVYVAKLRKYLDEDTTVEIINIHGTGFKLID